MSYRKAEEILPVEVIKLIQRYVDGVNIYIPRKENTRRSWGEATTTREELERRNQSIYMDYEDGVTLCQLAKKYYLSEKSIQRIIRQQNN